MDAVDRSQLPVRVFRLKPGDPWPDDDDSPPASAEERFLCTWQISLNAHALTGEPLVSSELSRHVARVVRGES